GFFVGGALLSTLEKASFEPVKWWSRIIARVVPSAIVVVLLTVFLSFYLMPPSDWWSSATHIIASALQFENLNLMRVGAEYLGRDQVPSAYQQFWALSLQFQMYAALMVIGLLATMSGRLR